MKYLKSKSGWTVLIIFMLLLTIAPTCKQGDYSSCFNPIYILPVLALEFVDDALGVILPRQDFVNDFASYLILGLYLYVAGYWLGKFNRNRNKFVVDNKISVTTKFDYLLIAIVSFILIIIPIMWLMGFLWF